jgi:beta-phosphoglucomutase-like phosphatase (HAD superfamily)
MRTITLEAANGVELPNINLIAGVASDFDETIFPNGEDLNAGKLGLHNQSRVEAATILATEPNLGALRDLSLDDHASAFHEAEVHSSEGAFHWLLQRAGIFRHDQRFDPHNPYIRQLVGLKDTIYTALMREQKDEVPGAKSFFQALHDGGLAGCMAIGSSGRERDISAYTHANGFSQIFPDELIVGKETVPTPKPSPDVFEMAASLIGVEPDRLLIIEDDPRGIEPGRRLGAAAVIAVSTIFPKNELLGLPPHRRPHYVAADFRDYLGLFRLS